MRSWSPGMTGRRKRGVFDAGEDHELVVAVGDLGEQERAAGLGDGFDHEDAGHDGVVGEVAREVRLVDGDVLDGDDALLRLHLDDAVDEQERVAVREDGHDLDDVHRAFAGASVGMRCVRTRSCRADYKPQRKTTAEAGGCP